MGQPRIGGYLISKLNLLFYSRVARLELQVDWELVDVLGHVGVVEGRVQEEGGQHNQDEGQQRGQERDNRPRSPLRHGGRPDPGLLHGKAARIWDSVSTRLDYDICKGGIRGPK